MVHDSLARPPPSPAVVQVPTRSVSAAPGGAASDGRSIAGMRVLIVEAIWLIAADVADMCSRAGAFPLVPVSCGADADHHLEIGTPMDAAIIAVDLADGLVRPLARRLRSAGIPFVFHCGLGLDQFPIDLCCASHCLKPVIAADLIETLIGAGDAGVAQAQSLGGKVETAWRPH